MLNNQQLSTLEYAHSCNVIHCDVTPMNLLMGREQQTLPRIYLIDYGLARGAFQDAQCLNHLPLTTGQPFVGTTTFASVNTHKGITLSRRDDIESLSYVLLYLLRGSLPWQTIKATSRTQRNRLAAKQKQARNVERLYKQYPVEFLEFYKHARQLGFAQKPDYYYHIGCFRALLAKG
jgi:serine/threonine protein kinase